MNCKRSLQDLWNWKRWEINFLDFGSNEFWNLEKFFATSQDSWCQFAELRDLDSGLWKNSKQAYWTFRFPGREILVQYPEPLNLNKYSNKHFFWLALWESRAVYKCCSVRPSVLLTQSQFLGLLNEDHWCVDRGMCPMIRLIAC